MNLHLYRIGVPSAFNLHYNDLFFVFEDLIDNFEKKDLF